MNRYESYENTGLDWVPEIPEHWSLTRSKFIFRNKSVKNCPDEPLLSVTQKDGVVLRSESDLNVWNPTEDVSGYKLIEPSNFVISLRSFEGGLELSTIKGIVSPAYTVLEKTKKKILSTLPPLPSSARVASHRTAPHHVFSRSISSRRRRL